MAPGPGDEDSPGPQKPSAKETVQAPEFDASTGVTHPPPAAPPVAPVVLTNSQPAAHQTAMTHSTPQGFDGYTVPQPYPTVSGVPVAPPAPLASPAPVVNQTVQVIQSAEPKPVVYVIETEPCCNVYWVLFVIGLLLFAPCLICGMLGICSEKRNEKSAGIANAIALGLYVLFIIVLVASA